MLYKTIFLSFFLLSISLFAEGFSNFVEQQLQNYEQVDDSNVSQEELEALVEKQSLFYSKALTQRLIDKDELKKESEEYEQKLFSLQRIIPINEKAGNGYAVLRDQIKSDSYELLIKQNEMLLDIFDVLDNKYTLPEFEEKIGVYIKKNQTFTATFNEESYDRYLELESESSTVLHALQNNIKEFKSLLEINKDLIVYLNKYQTKLYRLNKYAKYHLITPVAYLDSLSIVHDINKVLENYNLNVTKLLLITMLSIVIYLFRRFILKSLELLMKRISYLKDYAQSVTRKLEGPTDSLFLVFNLNMAVYVYNDFSSVEAVSRSFNIIYVLYATYMFYVGVNTISAIKLSLVDPIKTKIKKDVINVGIKIINFTIILIGVLLSLFFAGVDLTAVLSGLGIGGFALAFAAKDTISNFFGTISILFSDVFSQGDWIEIDGKEGVVVEIGLRVTTLRTFDNALIAIPNGTFASKDVKNWNKRKVGRRIKMSIGVKYSSKAQDIKNAVKEIREMLLSHPNIATPDTHYEHKIKQMAKLVSKDDLEGVKTNLFVYLDQFSSSSIDILIYCFTKSVVWEDWLKTKEDVMHKIMEILERNSLEFAFPSLSIYEER